MNDFYDLNIKNNLNIFHTNINGLESKFDNLHKFLSNTQSKMDIIAITETSQKNNDNFITNVTIEGYATYYTPSNSNKGGTALYVNEKFNFIERKDLSAQNDDYESAWVEIKNKLSKNIVTGCIYRHPRYNFKDLMHYLENCLIKLTKENKEIYLCGDFNIDLLKIEDNQNYQLFCNMLCSFGFLPKIVQPTRVTDHHSTLIDNIFSNNLIDETKSGNIFLSLSDHFSQFLTIKREKMDYKNLSIFQRDYSKFLSQQFRDDVSIQNWNTNLPNVNSLFIDFYSKLQGCVDSHAPYKKLSPKEIKLQSKPWISTEIFKLIKVRNKIFARKKRQTNNANTKWLYNLFSNRAAREIKKSKKKYYSEYFEMNKMNIKKIWSGIREIVNIRNNISTKITQLNINGKIIDNPKDVANQLNDFFVNVGPLTESSIPRSENISPNKFLKKRNQFDFFLAHVSHDEVFKIINTLQNKSAGPASIPVKLLKLILDLIIIPLCNIINLSFVSGSFPDPLKIVKVIPIHKNGSTQVMNNYRPISLLSIFDKTMENIMHERLYKFLELNNILYNKQFGFRKNNSTIDALIKITDKIRESVDKGKYGCGIFIDLRKAFDTVNHNILLLKMEHYGVRGPSLQWFRSYLSERKHVYINGECSELKQISCGVPQGSVLGPLLFLIYINDLPNISKKFDLYLFADDTNIYYEDKSLENLEIRVNKELKNLSVA